MEEKIRNAHTVAKELADSAHSDFDPAKWHLVYTNVFSAMCSAILAEIPDNATKEAAQT